MSSTAIHFTKAQKRWRISCTAIHFTLYLARPEKKNISGTNTVAQKRWRLAHTVIYSSRAILSLVAEMAVPKSPNSRNHLSPDSPHTVVEIEQITSNHGFDQTTSRSHLLEVDEADDSFFSDIDPSKLTKMVKEKDLNELSKFGGTEGLTKALRTDPENGICGGDDDEDLTLRKTKFGTNTYNKLPPKGLLHFVAEAFKDATIIVLLACAALSLGFGIKEHGSTEGWYEGGSMFIAVFLAVAVSALSNLTQEGVFDKLQQISNDIKIDVIRDGRRQEISIFDIMVGDVVFLTTGDQIPADGVFLSGDHSFKVDESSTTGESDHYVVEVNTEQNPFLLSGSKVAHGHATMLVTSVAMKTTWGNMMSSIACDSSKRTSLQAWPGFSVAFLVVLIRYISGSGNTKDEKGSQALDGIKTAVVTLTLSYSLKRMMANPSMVRKLLACETMGSATVICTDKTGRLTMKQMEVNKFWLGHENIEENHSDLIAKNVLELFHQGVGLNTTGTVCNSVSGSIPEFSGSPTEKAILSWAISELGMDMENLKQSSAILHAETFNSEKKRSGVSVRKKDDDNIHIHWKGAAEMVLGMCSNYYQGSGNVKSIDEEGRKQFEKIIQEMAASSLRCMAFAHKKVSEQEIKYTDEGKETHQKLEEDGMTLLGIVGLKDPCRPGAKKAIRDCRAAGVDIKMITGDNLFTAKAIATECGILGHHDHQFSGGEVVEGVEFRNYTHDERMEKVDQIRVMARSSPEDKLLMVQYLKQKGHVVAVTGDGTNDAPALKEADIGFCMGIQGSEVAKESSDIIILDDDFASVVTFLRWGRCIHNNMRKFVQFQLPVNVAVLVINFVAAVSAREVPPPTVQLLWVNLIMDSLGALALATEQPTDELMDKPPVGRSEPLTTNVMFRNLLAQALYQIAMLLTFEFTGRSILKVSEAVNNTIIFNTFVFCQVFNAFNSRKLEEKNVFTGLHKNRLFLGIIAMIVVLQIVMVEFLNKFADTVRLNWWQWVVCIAVAAVSGPIGWCVKSIPVSEEPILATSDVVTLIGDR